MRVGVGLPATIPGTPGAAVTEWARRADASSFSSLGVLDRVVYDNFEPMTVLAAAAAVTERITLASTIVIAPLRSASLLAKQAASINALAGGRLVLGVGLGAREDDYIATGSEYRTRGKRLTEQLVTLRRQWEDQAFGPRATAGRPLLLVGGSGGLAASRMARYADGAVHGGGPPRAFARAATEARAAWDDAGRPGSPLLWGMAYFQLGASWHDGRDYLRRYYAFTGAFAEKIAAGLLTDRDQLKDFIAAYADAGCDELMLFPTVSDLGQLELLSEAFDAA